MATKKTTVDVVTATFTMITKEPKTWGLRVPKGQGKKGLVVESVNRWGNRQAKRLVSKVADVPANEMLGLPACEVWTFQNA